MRKLLLFFWIFFIPVNFIIGQSNKEWDLIEAAAKGKDSTVLALLKKDININVKNYDGFSPLMFAIQNNHLSTVNLLIANKANVNLLTKAKNSPLILAAQYGNDTIAEQLITAGAELDHKNKKGLSPIFYSSAFGYFELTHMLIYYGASINLKDSQGMTALMLAVQNFDYGITKLLLENKAEVNHVDHKGNTALHFATSNADIEIARLLIDAEVPVNIRNNKGLSALDIAVMTNSYDLSKYLLDKGALINNSKVSRNNSLDLAKIYSDKKMVALLKQKGAKTNYNPNFAFIETGVPMQFNRDDFMMGVYLGISEIKYNVQAGIGYSQRLIRIPVLLRLDDNIAWQYHELRTAFYLQLQKQFCLWKSGFDVQTGLYAGIRESFSFGSYQGSLLRPRNTFVTSPLLGIYHQRPEGKIFLGYAYTNYGSYKVSPHWFDVGILFKIPLY